MSSSLLSRFLGTSAGRPAAARARLEEIAALVDSGSFRRAFAPIDYEMYEADRRGDVDALRKLRDLAKRIEFDPEASPRDKKKAWALVERAQLAMSAFPAAAVAAAEAEAKSDPKPEARPPGTPKPGSTAGRANFGARLLASFIDGLVVVAAPIILIAIGEAGRHRGVVAFGVFLYFLSAVAYFVYFEGGPDGQTLGKRAMGIRVVDFNTGGSIGYGRACIRLVGRYISSSFFYLGYLWMLWDEQSQCWHDKMANDVVVVASFAGDGRQMPAADPETLSSAVPGPAAPVPKPARKPVTAAPKPAAEPQPTPQPTSQRPASPAGSALEIAAERYARGEITRDEFQQLKEDLS